MLKMVDGTGIIGLDMICPLGVSTPQPPNYDRVELEGTGILVLPNSLDAPLERLELGGKTEQVQTSGKNLFDIATCPLEHDGVSFKIPKSNGNVVLMGDFEENTQYTLSVQKITSENANSAVLKFDYTDGTRNEIKIKDLSKKSLTSDSAKNVKQFVLINPFGGVHEVSGLQLEKGTTATPYEPYTGGKPSPSPEYPQEIKNSGKWNEETQKYEVDVKITGKNLFDMNKFIDTCNFTKNEDGTFIIDKYVERYDCFIPANTILSIEVLKVEDSSGAAALELFYEDGKSMYIGFGLVGVKTFLIQKDVAYIKVLAYRKHEYKYIQLEKGRAATPYEPYKEQSLTLTSDRPLTKWDRLVEQGGEIGWLYNSVNETIDGKTGKWSIQPASKIFYRTDITFPIAVPFCSELLGYDYSSVGYKKDTGITINNLGILCITLPEEVELTLDAYKQYLADNPLHVLYKDDSEEFVPLPQSEQNAIRALKTYYPTTVITVDGGELDPDIKVTYRKEI